MKRKKRRKRFLVEMYTDSIILSSKRERWTGIENVKCLCMGAMEA